MDQSLKEAAEKGNVSKLYELIKSDGNVLRRLDEVEFIDTPLHAAADKGCIGFAMEMMNLKPSFARKLNQQGLSPIHLAIKKGHKEMVLRFLEVDKDLVRVRGKKGKTPLHCISKVENHDGLLDKFLEACPDCIQDVTTKNRTALHIASKNNKLDVLQILINTLRKKDYYQEVLNRKDKDGNTALHLAASNNQHQMIRLLLKCKADKHVRNHAEKTALDEADHRKSISILHGCFSPRVLNSIYELKKQIIKYVRKLSSLIFHDMDNISGEDRSALLVILALLLTATYQATLSPPGGVWQADSSSNSSAIEANEEGKPGTSVMDEFHFLLFFMPTYVVFIVTFFLTLALLKPFPRGFRTALQVLLAFLAMCFDQSISFIAPTPLATTIINIFSAIVFILMVFMCIAYKVSKLSVSIVGSWILPSILFSISGGDIVVGVLQGTLLFYFLFDEFWKGSILVVGINIFVIINVVDKKGGITLRYPTVFLGCWVFLNLCRFCIKRFTQCCK